MSEARIPFGLSDGRMIAIDDVVERGLSCQCICCECHGPLVACKGEIRRHYFRHHAEMTHCMYPRETAIHKFAKQTIIDTLRCRLPHNLGQMLSASAEVSVENVRPDVLAQFSVEPVAIEIFVAHKVPHNKIGVFAKQKLAAIEIDLRPFRHADKGPDDWRAIVLDVADRVWLYPPKQVREENERRRREAIAAQRQHERELEVLIGQAEREWKARERELQEAREQERTALEIRQRQQAADQARWAYQAEQRAIKRVAEEREAAEARRKDAEQREAFARWRESAVASPELGKLIAAHGGYDKITPEAWRQWDADMARFYRIHRAGLRYLPDAEFVEEFRRIGF